MYPSALMPTLPCLTLCRLLCQPARRQLAARALHHQTVMSHQANTAARLDYDVGDDDADASKYADNYEDKLLGQPGKLHCNA